MKKIIKKILKEETSKKLKLKKIIDELGWYKAIEIVGGLDNLILTLYDGNKKDYWEDRVREFIIYQTEIQDPGNFDNEEEYADFCISQGMEYLRGSDSDWDEDDEDDQRDYDHGLTEDEIEEIENKMIEELYDELINAYNG